MKTVSHRLFSAALRALAAAAFLSVTVLGGGVSIAQTSFTGSYTQDFDSLGTGTTAPAGWSVHVIGTSSSGWSTSIPASGTTSAATPGTATTALVRQDDATASVTSNSTAFNFGVAGGGRSLGTSPTSLNGTALQLRLTNETVE